MSRIAQTVAYALAAMLLTVAASAAKDNAAGDTPFKTTLEAISVSGAVRVRIENTDLEQAWKYDSQQASLRWQNFSVLGPEGKSPSLRIDGERVANVPPVELGPGEAKWLYPTFMLRDQFWIKKPGKYEVRFEGWDTPSKDPRVRAVPPAEEVKTFNLGEAPSFWEEYVRRVLPIKPATWEFTDRANAVYRPVAGHERDVYGVSFLQLLHPGDGTPAAPRATIELWSTDPKGTRQMPTLYGKPAAPGEWTYLTTMSPGDIYLRADIADNSAALEDLWPNAHDAIRGALKTGGAAGLSEAQRTALSPTWDTISVVHTWGELRALPPFTIWQGVRAKIGIDSLSAAKWGHNLLYCLVESAKVDGLTAGFEPLQPLGSFMIGSYGEPALDFMWDGSMLRIFKPPAGTREILYVVSVPMETEFANYVELTIPWFMTAFAQARVETTGETFHPWIPFFPAAGGDAAIRHLAIPSNLVASPTFTGALPFAMASADSEVEDETPLPTLASEPRLRLSATTADGLIAVTVAFDTDIRAARAEKDYLARWWVNGKAFVPADASLCGAYKAGDEPPMAKQNRFQIDFVPSDIGAQKGDKIGLQLLYAPDGKRFEGEELLRKRLTAGALQRAPRLTNKVEFIAP